MQRQFTQLDVFTDRPYFGNPLAVVIDGGGLDTATMQRFANWTNLSETTFLLPPTDSAADYRVRIFTPVSELPFAGHPTLGSAHAWLQHGGVPRTAGVIVQECSIGLVTVRRDDTGYAFSAPPLVRSGSVDEATLREAVASLGIDRSAIVDAAWVDNGPGWLGLLLRSSDEVRAVRPGNLSLPIGLAGPCPSGTDAAYEVRGFYSANGTTFEDPVTGSLNASLAQWFIGSGRFRAPYVASQGSVLGRDGRIRITTDESGAVWVGGDVATCITGTVDLATSPLQP